MALAFDAGFGSECRQRAITGDVVGEQRQGGLDFGATYEKPGEDVPSVVPCRVEVRRGIDEGMRQPGVVGQTRCPGDYAEDPDLSCLGGTEHGGAGESIHDDAVGACQIDDLLESGADLLEVVGSGERANTARETPSSPPRCPAFRPSTRRTASRPTHRTWPLQEQSASPASGRMESSAEPAATRYRSS